MNTQLRLISRDRVEYVAHLVYRGDSYGPNGRLVSADYQTLVEFARPRLGGDHFIVALPAEELAEDGDGWYRKDMEALGLSAREADRLRRWIASPFSVSDAVVVLVGDDEEIQKARLALARLQLDPRTESNGLAAVDHIRRLPPQLVVVGQQIGQLEPLELVRRLHKAPESREVPVVVIGGDAEAARAAGAALHVPLPPDYTALVNGAAELLELV
jgi:CheY-like chemotaxis protein